MQRTGLVCVYDVLGYKDIINRDEIEFASKLIEDTLKEIPDRVKERFSKMAVDGMAELHKEFLATFHTLLVSDTIVLAAEIPDDGSPADQGMPWTFFISYVSMLQRIAFDEGLPMRGAVGYGCFYISDRCFAGRPLVEAFTLSNHLEFSGCVLTPSCEKVFWEVHREVKPGMYNDLLLPYEVPMTTGESKQLLLVNWVYPFPEWGAPPKNAGDYVVKAFHSHGKNFPPAALPKLQHTEIMIRHMLTGEWRLFR